MATELIRGLANLTSSHRGCVATIGNFDGVHRGHQALLQQVNEAAKRLNVPSVVVTFEPQPSEYFLQGKPLTPRLTRLREKFHALAHYGADKVLVLRFDAKLSALSAEEFVEKILVRGLGVKHVIVGDDFRFGKARQGDVEFLKKAGERSGFTAERLASVMIDGERVSSTRVRQALTAGDQTLAERLLGRAYTMEGRVVRGDQRGRSIGFPTANIYVQRKMTPVQGVYAVKMQGVTTDSLSGVANVGVRPTVGGTRTLLEVHLFDFNQEIYGQQVVVEFCKKLRDEKRYETLDLLKEQIAIDAKQARDYFYERI